MRGRPRRCDGQAGSRSRGTRTWTCTPCVPSQRANHVRNLVAAPWVRQAGRGGNRFGAPLSFLPVVGLRRQSASRRSVRHRSLAGDASRTHLYSPPEVSHKKKKKHRRVGGVRRSRVRGGPLLAKRLERSPLGLRCLSGIADLEAMLPALLCLLPLELAEARPRASPPPLLLFHKELVE